MGLTGLRVIGPRSIAGLSQARCVWDEPSIRGFSALALQWPTHYRLQPHACIFGSVGSPHRCGKEPAHTQLARTHIVRIRTGGFRSERTL